MPACVGFYLPFQDKVWANTFLDIISKRIFDAFFFILIQISQKLFFIRDQLSISQCWFDLIKVSYRWVKYSGHIWKEFNPTIRSLPNVPVLFINSMNWLWLHKIRINKIIRRQIFKRSNGGKIKCRWKSNWITLLEFTSDMLYETMWWVKIN